MRRAKAGDWSNIPHLRADNETGRLKVIEYPFDYADWARQTIAEQQQSNFLVDLVLFC